MIFLNALILAAGFAALVKGADIFVDGSSALARIFKVPSLIIGLTIVALGTSLPELAVSTSAALAGSNEIAFSNVVGSNIFNLLVVLGFCAVIYPVPVDSAVLKRDFPLALVSTSAVFAVVSIPSVLKGQFFSLLMEDNAGCVYRWLAVSLLVVFVFYIFYLIYDAKKNPPEEEGDEKLFPLWKCLLFIAAGIVLIVAGGKGVVYSAQNIARFFGMTETLIGLTVVALGTSLPELVTSVVAARKGETSLAVGNVIGSCIFNLLFILGVSAAIHPVAVNAASVYDMAILIAVSLFTWITAAAGKKIGRAAGLFMLICYAAETVFAVMR
jgi:cation:H+ antiporter